MAYMQQYTNGNSSATGRKRLSIYLYPASSNQDSLCEQGADKNDVFLGVRNMANQLINEGIIEYVDILTNYDHPDVNGSSPRDCRKAFRSWLDSQNISWTGVHLYADTGTGTGNAEVANSPNASALVNDRCAYLRCGSTRQWIRNAASHESLHTIINADGSNVKSMSEHPDNPGDRQHDLGTILGPAGDTSPMCTSYAEEHGRHGECSKDYTNVKGVYNETLTHCTKDGVQETVSDLN